MHPVVADTSTAAETAGPPQASADVLADLAHASQSLETAEPPEIVRWAVERFGPKLTMATAFGPEGCLIIHWLAAVAPQTFVFNLETGYQFQETLELRDRIARRYGLKVSLERPETTVEEYERIHGGPLYRTDSNRCCGDRKIAVIKRVLTRFDAWMSGIRRDQSPDRAAAPIVGWDKKFGVVKISPLANWTKAKVWDAIVKEDVPYNPLHDQGYVSIGCWPCTRAITDGEDERAGRWSGTAKTECGLHSRDS
jgi:phosphoadenosine phosphosulfate reductase